MAGINLPGESAAIGIENEIENDLDEEEELDSLASMKKIQIDGRKLAKERQKMKGKSTSELKRIKKETGLSTLAMFPSGLQLDDVILIGGATRIPAVRRLVKVMTGIDSKITINPDEAVSYGAAILAGIIDGDITDMQVMSAWQAAMYRTFSNVKKE
jgi:molecular chaperone DnaK (HSP70)